MSKQTKAGREHRKQYDHVKVLRDIAEVTPTFRGRGRDQGRNGPDGSEAGEVSYNHIRTLADLASVQAPLADVGVRVTCTTTHQDRRGVRFYRVAFRHPGEQNYYWYPRTGSVYSGDGAARRLVGKNCPTVESAVEEMWRHVCRA